MSSNNKKTIKQIIEAASGGKQKKVSMASESSFFNKTRASKGSKSTKLRDIFTEAAKGKKHQVFSTEKHDKNKQKLRDAKLIKKLTDSLTELQASYGDLNELFNNTVAAQDSTVASLLQDLRYTVSRLDKADFSLRFDVASGSLFVDGEDSIAVSTPDVLAMLASLTSLFPNKSISLSIDGDADYTDGAALDKLTELNGSPAPSVAAVPSVKAPEGSDIDDVLRGVGDSKLRDSRKACISYAWGAASDDEVRSILKSLRPDWKEDMILRYLNTPFDSLPVSLRSDMEDKGFKSSLSDGRIVDSELEPENRFTCTYKADTYSIWDKQLGILVKVVTTPKEADAMLDGLVAGASSASEDSVEGGTFDEEPLDEGEEVLDSARVSDCALGLDSAWGDCADFDVSYIKSLGWSDGKVSSFLKGVSEGSFVPFFSQLPAFASMSEGDNIFDLSSGAGLDFVTNNFASTQDANKMIAEAQSLDAMSSFMTAYSNLIYTAFNLTQAS